MSEYMTWFQFNSALGFALYWLPLVFCSVGYFVRTWKNYANDRRRRDELGREYYPIETIGRLLGRGLVSIVPVANMLAAVFDLAPEVFSQFFRWIGKAFNQPLVPERIKVDK